MSAEVMDRLGLPAAKLRAEWRGHLDWVSGSMDDLEMRSSEALREAFSRKREDCLSLRNYSRQLELLCGSLLLAIEWCGKRYGSGFEESFETATAEANRLRQRASRCAQSSAASAYFCDKDYDAAVLFAMYETRQSLGKWLDPSAHPVTQLGEGEGFEFALSLIYAAADAAFSRCGDHREGLRQAEIVGKLLNESTFNGDATCLWLADAADGLSRAGDSRAEAAAVSCAWRASSGVRHEGARLAVAARLARLAPLAPDAVVAALAALGEERAASEAWLNLGDPVRALAAAAKRDLSHVFESVDAKLAIKLPLNETHEAALARRLGARGEARAAAAFLVGRRKYEDLEVLFAASRQDKLVDVAMRLANTIVPLKRDRPSSVFAKEYAAAASSRKSDDVPRIALNKLSDNYVRAPTFLPERGMEIDVENKQSSDEDEQQNATCGTNDAVVEDASSLLERAADEDIESEVGVIDSVVASSLLTTAQHDEIQDLVGIDASKTSFQDDVDSEVVMEDQDVRVATSDDEEVNGEAEDIEGRISPSQSDIDEDDASHEDSDDDEAMEQDSEEGDDDDDDEFPPPDAAVEGEEGDEGDGDDSYDKNDESPQVSGGDDDDDGGAGVDGASVSEEGADAGDVDATSAVVDGASESEEGEREGEVDAMSLDEDAYADALDVTGDDGVPSPGSLAASDESDIAAEATPTNVEGAQQAVDEEEEEEEKDEGEDEEEKDDEEEEEERDEEDEEEDDDEEEVREEQEEREEDEEEGEDGDQVEESVPPPMPAAEAPPLAHIPEEDVVAASTKARPRAQRTRRKTRLSNASSSSRESSTSALTDIDVSNIIRGPRLRRPRTRS